MPHCFSNHIPRQGGVETGDFPCIQNKRPILFGDYVSYYLAMLYQIDPSPVKAIDFLKGQLEQNEGE